MRRLLLCLGALLLFVIPASGQTSFNVWEPQGTITLSGTSPEQPNTFYLATGCIVVSSPCIQLFYQTGGPNPVGPTSGMYYAECPASTPIICTDYGSNPVLPVSWGIKVFKNAGTYYCYYTTGFSTGSTIILVATSTNFTTWTVQSPTNTINTTNSSWASSVFQLGVAGELSGTWYGYYSGQVGTGSSIYYPVGMATSTDLINWTPAVGNPIPTFTPHPGIGSGNMYFQQEGGVYFGWSQSTLPNEANAQNSTAPGICPTDIFRWSSSSPAGPWVLVSNGNASTFYRTLSSEGVNTFQGQVADQSLLDDGLGNLWIYYTASTSCLSGSSYTINAAEAPSTTFTRIGSSYEGVYNVPISGNPSLNFNVLASDTFTRANANPIGGNWSPVSTSGSPYNFKAAQLVSDAVEGTVAGASSDSYWNALSWNADQWATTTVGTLSASSYVGVSLRCSTSGAQTAYRLYWGGNTGSSGTWYIQPFVAGTAETSLSSGTLTVSTGDTLTLAIIGYNLYFYWNGILVSAVLDTNSYIATGAAGFMISPTTAVGNATITGWSGGTFQNAPSFANATQIGGFLVSSRKKPQPEVAP